MVIYNAFKLKATKKRTQIELLGPMHNMVPNGIVHRDDFFLIQKDVQLKSLNTVQFQWYVHRRYLKG